MSEWKDSIPDPIKQAYRFSRKKVLNPESDWLFNMRYRDTLQISYGDTQVTYNTADLAAKRWFYPRYRTGSLHEPVVTRALLDQLDSTSTFFDIGANVGFYTIISSYFCDRVYSFEMDPKLVEIIHSHIEHNPSRSADIDIVSAAVSDQTNKYISFKPHIANNPSTNSIVESSEEIEDSLRVPTVSLNDFVEQENIYPNVVKVDVEGAEEAVLSGSNCLLPRIESLFLEVHPSLLDGRNGSTDKIISKLYDHGFGISKFTDHRADAPLEQVLEPVTNSTTIQKNTMLLCTR